MLTELDPKTKTSPASGIGAIDCDVHPRSPEQADLLPFVDSYWKDMMPYRDIGHMELMSYPFSTKPFRAEGADGGVASPERLAEAHLDPMGISAAILNVVNGVQALFDPYMQTMMCQATNRWLAAEWLSRDPRLRASLLVPFRHPEEAVAEIRRYADDRRFVQVLAICMGDATLGQRQFWPIYRAASDAGFALSVHPGSNYRHAPTQSGFMSYLVEEQVNWSQGFASQAASLLTEGVLSEFPDMKVVMSESGISWLFGVSWRMAKDWRGCRVEVPWLKEGPDRIMERQFRFTLHPFDLPVEPEEVAAVIECIGGPEMLLFSSDFPHDHGPAAAMWPPGLSADLATAICRENVLSTYPRLEV
ncbi:amidohydrolase family protein [Martelella soudanensis]|uniref:amidohydrolase family protein n=1 Tax=unclassified Martelella TaxID=2629616 RepID=UPI0015DE5FD6|nr:MULTISPECIES: amidohydrolase family protein [unclassified Martelella]